MEILGGTRGSPRSNSCSGPVYSNNRVRFGGRSLLHDSDICYIAYGKMHLRGLSKRNSEIWQQSNSSISFDFQCAILRSVYKVDLQLVQYKNHDNARSYGVVESMQRSPSLLTRLSWERKLADETVLSHYLFLPIAFNFTQIPR
jgi:hypothetical protein